MAVRLAFLSAHPQRSDERHTFHAFLTSNSSQHRPPHQRLTRIDQARHRIVLDYLIRFQSQQRWAGQTFVQIFRRVRHQAIRQMPVFVRKPLDVHAPERTRTRRSRFTLSPYPARADLPQCGQIGERPMTHAPVRAEASRSICGSPPSAVPSSRLSPSANTKRLTKGRPLAVNASIASSTR